MWCGCRSKKGGELDSMGHDRVVALAEVVAERDRLGLNSLDIDIEGSEGKRGATKEGDT